MLKFLLTLQSNLRFQDQLSRQSKAASSHLSRNPLLFIYILSCMPCLFTFSTPPSLIETHIQNDLFLYLCCQRDCNLPLPHQSADLFSHACHQCQLVVSSPTCWHHTGSSFKRDFLRKNGAAPMCQLHILLTVHFKFCFAIFAFIGIGQYFDRKLIWRETGDTRRALLLYVGTLATRAQTLISVCFSCLHFSLPLELSSVYSICILSTC